MIIILFFIIFVFENRNRYENFEIPKHGYEHMDGDGGGGKGGADSSGYADDGGGDSPLSLEEIERPPLRHIDKYIRAECPCLTTRYTIALMTCLGFIISFGMRCNMGMAKLQFENGVSNLYNLFIYLYNIFNLFKMYCHALLI